MIVANAINRARDRDSGTARSIGPVAGAFISLPPVSTTHSARLETMGITAEWIVMKTTTLLTDKVQKKERKRESGDKKRERNGSRCVLVVEWRLTLSRSFTGNHSRVGKQPV